MGRKLGLPIKVVFDMGHRRLQGWTRQVDGKQVTPNAPSIVFGIACCNTQMQVATFEVAEAEQHHA